MSPADYRRYYQRSGAAEVVLRLDRERAPEGPVRVA
jgi:hypothetical protein